MEIGAGWLQQGNAVEAIRKKKKKKKKKKKQKKKNEMYRFFFFEEEGETTCVRSLNYCQFLTNTRYYGLQKFNLLHASLVIVFTRFPIQYGFQNIEGFPLTFILKLVYLTIKWVLTFYISTILYVMDVCFLMCFTLRDW